MATKKTPFVGKSTMERKVFAPVLIPNEPDSDGDVVSEEKIQQVHDLFNEKYGNIDVQHSLQNVGKVISSYITETELTFNVEGEKRTYPKGTWMMGVKVENDKTWELITKGVLTGFSIMAINPAIQENTTKAEGDERVTLADLGDGWIVNAVSIVDNPAVQRAKWVAIKSASSKLLSMFGISAKSEDKFDQLEEVTEVTEEQLKELIKQIVEECIAEKQEQPEEVPAEEEVVKTESEEEVEQEEVEKTETCEEGEAEKTEHEEQPQEEVQPEEQPEEVVEEEVEKTDEVSEIEQLKAELEELKNQLASTKSASQSKRLTGQDGLVEQVKEIVIKSDRDVFGRKIKN